MKKAFAKLRITLAKRVTALVLCFTCLGGLTLSAAQTAFASSTSDLSSQLSALEKKLQEDKQALAALQKETKDATAAKKNLESQIATLQSQLNILAEDISQLEADITEKEEEITEKEQEITQKQADIDAEWSDFKDRVAAMQEMRDRGTIALLGSVTNLYQLLTFSDVLQDISNKDTEILDNMKAQKEDLQQAKEDLETAKTELEDQKTELEATKKTMDAKQTELSTDLVKAKQTLADAQAAQNAAQDQVEEDEMDYEAVKAQMQALISAGQANYSDLAFDGSFIMPVKSYTRINDSFGYRTDPVYGGTRFHGGQDISAPAGTPIYAIASGYVQAAGWNNGGYGYYVLIYHGKMSDGITYSSLYGHMLSQPVVSAGEYVSQGQLIGYVGSTGKSTGNHLHLEIWQGSTTANSVSNKATRVNPKYYVPGLA